jgi:hypothetical protein
MRPSPPWISAAEARPQERVHEGNHCSLSIIRGNPGTGETQGKPRDRPSVFRSLRDGELREPRDRLRVFELQQATSPNRNLDVCHKQVRVKSLLDLRGIGGLKEQGQRFGRTQGQTACFRTRTSYPLWALLLAQRVVEHRTDELVNDFVVSPWPMARFWWIRSPVPPPGTPSIFPAKGGNFRPARLAALGHLGCSSQPWLASIGQHGYRRNHSKYQFPGPPLTGHPPTHYAHTEQADGKQSHARRLGDWRFRGAPYA